MVRSSSQLSLSVQTNKYFETLLIKCSTIHAITDSHLPYILLPYTVIKIFYKNILFFAYIKGLKAVVPRASTYCWMMCLLKELYLCIIATQHKSLSKTDLISHFQCFTKTKNKKKKIAVF